MMTKNQKKLFEVGMAGALFGLAFLLMPSWLLLWALIIPGVVAWWLACLVFSWWAVSEIDMRMEDE